MRHKFVHRPKDSLPHNRLGSHTKNKEKVKNNHKDKASRFYSCCCFPWWICFQLYFAWYARHITCGRCTARKYDLLLTLTKKVSVVETGHPEAMYIVCDWYVYSSSNRTTSHVIWHSMRARNTHKKCILLKKRITHGTSQFFGFFIHNQRDYSNKPSPHDDAELRFFQCLAEISQSQTSKGSNATHPSWYDQTKSLRAPISLLIQTGYSMLHVHHICM